MYCDASTNEMLYLSVQSIGGSESNYSSNLGTTELCCVCCQLSQIYVTSQVSVFVHLLCMDNKYFPPERITEKEKLYHIFVPKCI